MLESFLESIATHGTSDEVCDLGISYELCENPCMQRVLQLRPPLSGIRVAKIDPVGPCFQRLEVDDVLMTINGVKVGWIFCGRNIAVISADGDARGLSRLPTTARSHSATTSG